MVVRVRLKIKSKSKEVTTPVLVNTGFESEEPQLIIPLKLAEIMEITSEEVSIEDFSTAGGGRASGYRIEGSIEVELVLEDRTPIKALTYITILPGETEVIMNDCLASKLGIIILDSWKGYWCLRDELGAKQRSSTMLKEWK